MFSKFWKKLTGQSGEEVLRQPDFGVSDDKTQEQIDQLDSEVAALYQMGWYEKAIDYAARSVELTRQTVGEQHPDFATSLNNLARLYRETGNYAAAEPLFLQAIEIRRHALGEAHPDFAASLNNLALLYDLIGNYPAAELFYRQASEIARTTLGEHHADFAISLNNLAMLYYSTGNYAAAEPLSLQAIEILSIALGETHPDFATSINSLAIVYYSIGNYAAAEQRYKQAMEIRRSALGEQHPDFGASLNNLAMLYLETGDYAAAEPLLRQALEIRRTTLGEVHPDFAQGLNNLASLYYATGKYAAAEPLLRQVLEIRRTALGDAHPDFAVSLNNLAMLYREMGNYAAAEPLLRQALEITRTALGEAHPGLATSLNNLASIYDSMGDYVAAAPLSLQSIEIKRVALGGTHPDFAMSLNNLAMLYYSIGNYAAAEPLCRQALEITRTALGEAHPAFATSLSNLAWLYKEMGNYTDAEQLLRQTIKIRRNALGETHPDFAISLNNLALLYDSMGDYLAAEPLLRQAIEIKRIALGETHPDFAKSLHNLAMLYYSIGNYAAAEAPCRQALEITRTALGEAHRDYAAGLSSLALLYVSMGDYSAAEPLYKQAMEITRSALGEHHPAFAMSLSNLAVLNDSIGDYAAAEPLYKQAMEIRRSALGEQHPDFAMSLNNLASLLAATGRERDAQRMMQEALTIDDRMIGQVFSISSEKQRTAYLETIRRNLEAFLSLVSQHLYDSPEAVRSAFSLGLRRKAIGAEALAAQRDAVLGGKYPEAAPKLKEITMLRSQIAQKHFSGPGKEGLQAHQQLLAEWYAQKERIEAEVARHVPEMNLEENLRSIDHKVVAMAIPEGVTLVEFVRFNVFDFRAVPGRGEKRWRPARYIAFVMPSGEPNNAQMIDLGEAEPIDRMIATFRSTITGEEEDNGERGFGRLPPAVRQATGDDVGAQLREAVFTPLLKAFGNRKCLIISPDGDLTRLPFEILPADDGRRLIDEYQVSYLAAGRDVIRFGFKSNRMPARSLVVADPNFDFRGKAMASGTTAGLGRLSRDLNLDEMRPFDHLPGTKLEGERIAAMLDAELWLGDTALDAPLKKCRSPRILHFATSGFFLQDQARDPNEDLLGIAETSLGEGALDHLSYSRVENPLLRSGLVLAGVNTWLERGELMEEAEDGLLTAEDVCGIDLLDTELVVLSACVTGLGEVRVGEGVLGLRRAFVLAGAKTLVMSLWNVPDVETRELMEDFYRRILGADGNPPQPRADALRDAQLSMKAKASDPWYWGAFICQGDPGPLPEWK